MPFYRAQEAGSKLQFRQDPGADQENKERGQIDAYAGFRYGKRRYDTPNRR